MKINKFIFLFLLAGQIVNGSEITSAETPSAKENKENEPFEILGAVISSKFIDNFTQEDTQVLHIKCIKYENSTYVYVPITYVPINGRDFPDFKENLTAKFKVKKSYMEKFPGSHLFIDILEIKRIIFD